MHPAVRTSTTTSQVFCLVLLVLVATTAIPASAQSVPVAEREAINPGLGATPSEVDRSDPESTWRSFLDAGRQGRFNLAAHCLDLTEVPEDQQWTVGEEVAEQLYRVLERVGRATVASSATSDPVDNTFVAASFDVAGEEAQVWLRRTLDQRSGETLWLLTRRTVSDAPLWYRTVVERVVEQVVELNPGLAAVVGLTRETPRDAVVGYLTACREGHFDVAAHYLDLSELPAAEQAVAGPKLARRFKIVLDQTFWVVVSDLSNDPGGLPEPGLAPDQELLTTIVTDGVEIPIFLRRHLVSGDERVWTFGAGTVGVIDRLYAVHGYGWPGDVLPGFFFSVRPLEIELWQWCGALVLILLAWVVARLLTPIITSAMRRAAGKTEADWDDALIEAVSSPLRLAVIAVVLFLTFPWLKLSVAATAASATVGRMAAILIVGWFTSRCVGVVSTVIEQSAVATGNQVLRAFAPLVARLIKAAVWIVVAVVAADAVGYPVTGLIAGLGIGGLAFAFAAQKTIENLFGSFAVAGDRPFEIGNFVTLGGITGTVEEVGLRSTRLRTADRTLVTIPNASVMSNTIENFSKRDRIKFATTVGLLYGTSAAQIEYVIDEIKKHLLAHPRVFHDLVRVRFEAFGDSSLNVTVLTYILTTDFNEFTAIREEINFAIMKIVEASGSGFAFPSRTIYQAQEGGVDSARAGEIGAEIERRRGAGELWIPEAPTAED